MTNRPFPLSRSEWIQQLLPGGVPQLWCPPLTPYDHDGAIDAKRIAAHLRFISPWVGGLLVPGSTGDGWELSKTQSQQLLDIVLGIIQPLGTRLLIGALRPDAEEAARFVKDTVRRLDLDASSESAVGFARSQVCGFAICPPRGADLSQIQIERGLLQVLDLGFPTALYQLPQVTQNEMSPTLLSALAQRYENFILFKDTSGRDEAARSNLNFYGVFLVRGMEGEFRRWLKAGGGPYDGFLLSSANYFARELHSLIEHLHAGRLAEATELSTRLSGIIAHVFALVKDVSSGNAFSNAGKAFDHYFAHGPRAAKLTPPRIHCGQQLPAEIIKATGESLIEYGLMPERGYLE